MKELDKFTKDDIFTDGLVGGLPDLGTEIEKLQTNPQDFGSEGFGGFSSEPDEDLDEGWED